VTKKERKKNIETTGQKRMMSASAR